MEINSVNQSGQITFNPDDTGSIQQIQQSSNNNLLNTDSETENQSITKTPSEKDVQKAVDKLNKLFEDKPTHAKYETYGKSKTMIVDIVDNATNKVVQQIPSKQIVDMIDTFCQLAGILVDKRA